MHTTLDLARASNREPLGPNAEGLSSATFERVVLDGQSHVIKRISYDTDWVMRFAQDTGVPRVVRLHAAGWIEQLPHVIDTALVDVAFDPDTGIAELLMRDVGSAFLRDSDPITADQQEALLDAMAQLHVATQGLVDDLGLTPPAVRWTMFDPAAAQREAERGPLTGVPAVLAALLADPTPLINALAATPQALVHGDWKGGNLGLADDGRVVLVDWAFPCIDAPCADLGWYLAVNCDRLPESKEATIQRYRAALHRHGMDTAGWWDRQLPLALLGSAMQMAWSKCDQPEELAWWSDRVAEATPLL